MKVEQYLEQLYKKDTMDYGICPAPTNAQEGLNVLAKHFLGEDWYVTLSMGTEQVNTEIICEILSRTQPKESMWQRFVGFIKKD